MTYLVLGGSASGKSEYAESLALKLAGSGPRIYLATMKAYGQAGAYRVKRHRALREGKGFETLEIPTNLEQALEAPAQATLLVEDLSNLLANQMFAGDQPNTSEALADEIVNAMGQLTEHFEHVVFVSNNIFEDGVVYDAATRSYVELLGQIHCKSETFVDHIVEVVLGLPQELK